MDYSNSPACSERFYELEADIIEARLTSHQGKPLALDHQLRQSLGRVAREVQEALNDDAVSTADDVAMFCAAEAKKALKIKRSATNEERGNYAHTIFYYSCLWLSDTPTCH